MNSYNGFTPHQRQLADDFLKLAVRTKQIPPPDRCRMCGTDEGHLWFHLEDYARPIEDRRVLCIECHMRLHGRFKRPNAWRRYCLALRVGYRPKAWRSMAHFFAAHGARQPDEPEVLFQPDPYRWWEMLPL